MKRAFSYASNPGYPVIAKPNSKSQGQGVTLAWGAVELARALRGIFKLDPVALVEQYLPGRDYRVVVLDGQVMSAYERFPLSVVGDGKSSISKLLRKKQKYFASSGRDIGIKLNDPRVKVKLAKQNSDQVRCFLVAR